MTTTEHDAEVASRFDALAGRFKRDVAANDYRLAAVARGLEGLERPRVLDLGCGKGRFARHLANAGASVVGLDLSAGMLADASGLDRVKGTGRRLPFADASFDAVIAIESLEHGDDPRPILAEARRVLRPGGRLIVVDKSTRSLDTRRPWLPGVVVKWIDERRGRWMYPADGPVRERWFGPGAMARRLGDEFRSVRIDRPLAPEEAARWVFRAAPWFRRMVCWTAIAPGGDD